MLGRPGIDWQFTDGANEKEVRPFLLREILEHCATKNMDWSRYKFYPAIEDRRVTLAQEQRNTEMAQKDAFAEENMSLQSRLEKMKADHTQEVNMLQNKITTLYPSPFENRFLNCKNTLNCGVKRKYKTDF